MQDAADHPPVVYPFFATHVRWQIGLDLPPLLIAQPKQVAPHLVDSRINELPENQQPIQPTTLLLSFDPSSRSPGAHRGRDGAPAPKRLTRTPTLFLHAFFAPSRRLYFTDANAAKIESM
jgi:hypothetical protein